MMANVRVVIPTGGNLPGLSSATTTGYSLEINGTKVVTVPVKVEGVTYYMIAVEAWAWANKTDA